METLALPRILAYGSETQKNSRATMAVGKNSLESFLAEVERRAFRMARIATRNDADALDIVQDAMLSLVQSYKHRSAEEWPALFHRILQNRILDWHRRETRQKRFFVWWNHSADDDTDDDILENIPETTDSNPAELLARAADVELVICQLERLPLRQQQAFLLRVWEGLDVEDTAAAMGCSAGSVKTHLFRAMQSMRAVLEPSS